MGASDFMVTARGSTAREAFEYAVRRALYEHGHGGYTGSIAEKYDFVMFDVPEGQAPRDYANKLIADSKSVIDDKWGPAGCVKLSEEEFLFFGWASS